MKILTWNMIKINTNKFSFIIHSYKFSCENTASIADNCVLCCFNIFWNAYLFLSFYCGNLFWISWGISSVCGLWRLIFAFLTPNVKFPIDGYITRPLGWVFFYNLVEIDLAWPLKSCRNNFCVFLFF
jgi:hypothetical protein